MFENDVIVSRKDKEDALYHIRKVNKILEKYPYASCSGCYTVTTISRAKSFSGEAEKWIGYLDTPITQRHLTDCSIDLKNDCSMECDRCICKNCDKRFDCDGGNPVTGCGQ